MFFPSSWGSEVRNGSLGSESLSHAPGRTIHRKRTSPAPGTAAKDVPWGEVTVVLGPDR